MKIVIKNGEQIAVSDNYAAWLVARGLAEYAGPRESASIKPPSNAMLERVRPRCQREF